MLKLFHCKAMGPNMATTDPGEQNGCSPPCWLYDTHIKTFKENKMTSDTKDYI